MASQPSGGAGAAAPDHRLGRIVVLNGAPRSGKSSIVAALQQRQRWINLGVDALMPALPQALRPGIGLRPGGERAELEPEIARLYAALFATLAAHARQGFDVVADLGIHEDYRLPIRPWAMMAQQLAGLPVLLVGVRCPIEIIMARRNADPAGGYYAAGPGVPEPVRRWQDAVHRPGLYDLDVDTAALSPGDAAARIEAALAFVAQNSKQPGALAQLAQI